MTSDSVQGFGFLTFAGFATGFALTGTLAFVFAIVFATFTFAFAVDFFAMMKL